MAVHKTHSRCSALIILTFVGTFLAGVDKAATTRDLVDKQPVPAWSEAAYPVKWDIKDHPLAPPPHSKDAPSEGFSEAAYPVKWDIKDHPLAPPPHSKDAPSEGFSEAAYPVKWDIKDHPLAPPPHSKVKARGHGLHVQRGMLFLRSSLYPGAAFPQGTKLGVNGEKQTREFISKANSDVVPFGYSHLVEILKLFNVPRGSRMEEQVVKTLHTCEARSGEPHTCATSAEAEAEFAAAALGIASSHLRRAVTVVHGNEPSIYIVASNGIKPIGEAVVPCHPMAYPYLVRFCHKPENVEALSVKLIGVAGGEEAAATAVAVCHSSTSMWDQRYFDMLNATRGEEICHFMPHNYVLWVSGGEK